MRRRLFLPVAVAGALLLALGCSDDDAPDDAASGAAELPTDSAGGTDSDNGTDTGTDAGRDDGFEVDAPSGTAFTWVTTMDVDGSGYVLTVDGDVGDDHAAYTMRVDVLLGDGVDPSLESSTAGAAVNGVVEPGAPLDQADPDGVTEVIVDGTDRWYRSPWLLGEASDAMDGAAWVRVVDAGEAVFVADISRRVLAERHDAALRSLLDLVDAGEQVRAPSASLDPGPDPGLDRLLSPWLGLRGPEGSDGAPAVVTGDVTEGSVSWEQTLPNGRLAGEVTWEPADATPPAPPAPDDVVDLDQLAERFGQAG